MANCVRHETHLFVQRIVVLARDLRLVRSVRPFAIVAQKPVVSTQYIHLSRLVAPTVRSLRGAQRRSVREVRRVRRVGRRGAPLGRHGLGGTSTYYATLRRRQLAALLGRVHVRAQYPFDVGLGLLERPETDLVGTHVEARADLGEVHVAVCRHKDVMPGRLAKCNVPKRDKVILVRKGHDTLRVFLGHGEQETQHILHALAQPPAEALKD